LFVALFLRILRTMLDPDAALRLPSLRAAPRLDKWFSQNAGIGFSDSSAQKSAECHAHILLYSAVFLRRFRSNSAPLFYILFTGCG
jgi:hypothetical protein